MNLRRLTIALALAALVALAIPAVASANFAIHGNYVDDTDACAGCHRAHTSVSTITWSAGGSGQSSALLVSTATKMEEFCFACHDGNGIGADTNVLDGIYLGDEFGTPDSALNGGGTSLVGGTDPVTSKHMTNGASWGAYGGGYYGDAATDTATDGTGGLDPTTGTWRNTGMSTNVKMDCATCHDPHGSANYRILKAEVNGNYVGGYKDSAVPEDPNPDGFVSSVETGWPAGGFRLHTAYPNYKPNYTEARYARGYDMLDTANGEIGTAENPAKGMSGWCAGCHSVYNLPRTAQTKSTGETYTASASKYNAGDTLVKSDGTVYNPNLVRHRHPMNVPLSNYQGSQELVVAGNDLPLAHSLEESSTGPAQQSGDWIECLTCHRAHGTAATMAGWANEKAVDPDGDGVAGPDDEIADFISRNAYSTSDQDETFSQPSALLRGNNRYVCEECHNK